RRPASSEPSPGMKEIIPPKPEACRRASACWGCAGSPGYRTRLTCGWRARNSASSRAFVSWRSILTASVFTPRRASQQSIGPGTQHPGLGPEGALDRLGVRGRNEAEAEPEPGQDFLEQAVGAAVEVVPGHDVVPGREGHEERGGRGEPGAETQPVLPALERRQVRLERLARAVVGAGVLVALVAAERFLGVGRGLVDRDHDRPGRGIGLLAGMDGAG